MTTEQMREQAFNALQASEKVLESLRDGYDMAEYVKTLAQILLEGDSCALLKRFFSTPFWGRSMGLSRRVVAI